MVEIQLWSGLKRFTDGVDVVSVEGENIGQLLDNLVKAYPQLEGTIEAGVSLAIDGRLIANDRTAKVSPDAEVFLLQQLKGG